MSAPIDISQKYVDKRRETGIQAKQDKEASDETVSVPASGADPDEPARIKTALKQLDSHLSVVHASLPPRTALVVFTGHSDPRTMGKLQARKAEFENALRNGIVGASGNVLGEASIGAGGTNGDVRWSAADARALEEAVELAKRGLLFLCIKGDS